MNINPGKTEFTDAEHAEVRQEVRAALAEGLSQAAISRESEVPQATLSQYLSDTYPNPKGKAEAAAKLTKWLNARREATSLRNQMPQEPNYLALKDSKRIIATLQFAWAAGEMVLIGGAPGTSKTSACSQFAHDTPRTWYTYMDPTTRGVPTMLLELLAAMGVTEKKGTPQVLMREICAQAAVGRGLFLVDDAQHLSEQALETLRAINDRIRKANGQGIGIALLGNELAQTRVASTGGQAAFAQVASRFAKRVWLKAPHPDDAAALAHAWASHNGEEIGLTEVKFCQDIASRPGGLRNIEKTMRSAILVARASEQPLTIDHLKGAYAALSGR